MGKQLYETSSRFRESILSCQKLCVSQGLPPVAELIADGNADTEAMTVVQQQITTVVLEIARADLWRSWGVQPDLLIGHSLGEYAALCISGVLSVSDTLHLVGRRASMMEQQCTPGSHAMLAVGASVENVKETLTAKGFGSCEIACRNAPDMTVVGGTVEDLTNLHQILQAAKIKTKFLSVPYAFHSAQVDPILADLEASARGVHFSKPLIPIALTLTTDVISSAGTFTPMYLKRQAREQVNFVGTLKACESKGFVNDHTLWIEIGPEPVCLGMIRSTIDILPRRLLPTIRSGEENWATIASSVAAAYLSNVPMSWTEYHRDYVSCLTLLELPTYAFDVKDHWSSYRQDLLAPAADQILSMPETLPEKQRLRTTCLQNIEKESWEGDKATFTFSAYTSEPRIFDAIQGHLVDHTAICPASVFCDMALTAANYIYRKTKPDKSVLEMSLRALEITHPLVVGHCNPEQMVEVTAAKRSHDDDIVRISFKSKDRSSYHEHGSCEVRFGKNDEWKTIFSRTLHLVKKRIVDLTKSAVAGSCHRLQRSVVYKLFAELVDYSDKYQGIEEVFLDDEHGDAAARIKLRPSAGTGDFTQSPYWVDAMVHLAGFVLNGNVKNTNDIAYISAGFETLHIFEDLSETKSYTSYVSIQAAEKKDVFTGDVHVFEGERYVALCSGIYFHRMAKKSLRAIFGQAQSRKTLGKTEQSANAAAISNSQHLSYLVSEKKDSTESMSNNSSTSGLGSTMNSSQTSLDSNEESDKADKFLKIVASQSGYEIADMEPSTLFSDMGVDSIMSIAIFSAAQRQLNLELPASLFDDCPSVSDLRKEFGNAQRSTDTAGLAAMEPIHEMKGVVSLSPMDTTSTVGDESIGASQEAEGFTSTSLPPLSTESFLSHKKDVSKTFEEATGAWCANPKTVASHDGSQEITTDYSSHVVLIRGRASSKNTPLFLVTDGAGSATGYVHLPALSTGNRIYALEFPFLHAP